MPHAPAGSISRHHRQAVAKVLLRAAPLQVGMPCIAPGQHLAHLQLPAKSRGGLEARKRPAEVFHRSRVARKVCRTHALQGTTPSLTVKS